MTRYHWLEKWNDVLNAQIAVCIDRADVNVRTAVRRWRRFPVWGEGRFGDHTLLVKAPPQIPTHMSVTMRRERPSQVSTLESQDAYQICADLCVCGRWRTVRVPW